MADTADPSQPAPHAPQTPTARVHESMSVQPAPSVPPAQAAEAVAVAAAPLVQGTASATGLAAQGSVVQIAMAGSVHAHPQGTSTVGSRRGSTAQPQQTPQPQRLESCSGSLTASPPLAIATPGAPTTRAAPVQFPQSPAIPPAQATTSVSAAGLSAAPSQTPTGVHPGAVVHGSAGEPSGDVAMSHQIYAELVAASPVSLPRRSESPTGFGTQSPTASLSMHAPIIKVNSVQVPDAAAPTAPNGSSRRPSAAGSVPAAASVTSARGGGLLESGADPTVLGFASSASSPRRDVASPSVASLQDLPAHASDVHCSLATTASPRDAAEATPTPFSDDGCNRSHASVDSTARTPVTGAASVAPVSVSVAGGTEGGGELERALRAKEAQVASLQRLLESDAATREVKVRQLREEKSSLLVKVARMTDENRALKREVKDKDAKIERLLAEVAAAKDRDTPHEHTSDGPLLRRGTSRRASSRRLLPAADQHEAGAGGSASGGADGSAGTSAAHMQAEVNRLRNALAGARSDAQQVQRERDAYCDKLRKAEAALDSGADKAYAQQKQIRQLQTALQVVMTELAAAGGPPQAAHAQVASPPPPRTSPHADTHAARSPVWSPGR